MRRDVGNYNSALLYGRPEKDLSVQGLQPNGVSYANYGVAQVRRNFNSSRLRTDDLGRNRLGSANNKKSARSNQSRLGGRIPDIYGKVLAVPDLLTTPYIVYKDAGSYVASGLTYYNYDSFELNYLCVSRGNVSVSNTQIRSHAEEPQTIDVYGPNTSPISSTGTIGLDFVAPLPSISGTSSDITDQVMLKNPDWTSNTTDSSTLGPFIFENCEGVSFNVRYDSIQSSGTWYTGAVSFQVQLQLGDDSDVPYGSTHTVVRSFDSRQTFTFKTYNIDAPFSGRMQCKLIKHTGFLPGEGSIGGISFPSAHKKVYLLNMYGKSKIDTTHFGDVTTMRVALKHTEGNAVLNTSGADPEYNSKSPKSLGLTCEAERNITGTNTAFSDIAKAVCLDTKIGNRSASEVDTTQLAALQTEIETYFGTSKAGEFGHTFDDIDTSFEETLNTVCRVGFVQVYRQGPVIKFKFEQPTTTSKLLLNHRNKIPGSESRTINFGYLDDKDGVSFQYRTIDDVAQLDFDLPGDETETNVETDGPVGITSKLQAYFHAHRQFNRQKYQNTSLELEAMQEADLLLVNDLIKVSNNTRPNTWDGEIVSKNNLVLTLSQPYTGSNNANIFIQSTVLGVLSVGITKVSNNSYQVTLDSDITQSISLNDDAVAKSVYEIVEDTSTRQDAFLVSEITSNDGLTVNVLANNYDVRYYSNDKDYINEVVDINGDLL